MFSVIFLLEVFTDNSVMVNWFWNVLFAHLALLALPDILIIMHVCVSRCNCYIIMTIFCNILDTSPQNPRQNNRLLPQTFCILYWKVWKEGVWDIPEPFINILVSRPFHHDVTKSSNPYCLSLSALSCCSHVTGYFSIWKRGEWRFSYKELDQFRGLLKTFGVEVQCPAY